MIKKLVNLDLDGAYTSWVLSRTSWFRHIHPNYISLVGLATDVLILYAILSNALWIVGLGLCIRYSCDCLDGAVARKYGKVSDIGGLLDTIADNTLIFVLFTGMLKLLNVEYFYVYSIGIVTANLIYLLSNASLIHHYNVKKPGNWFHNLYRFGVNNNVLIYTAFFIAFSIIC